MSGTSKAAQRAARAISRTMASPAWNASLDPDDQGWMLMEALCEELHPLGPVAWPAVHNLRKSAGRVQRDEDIRRDFDGRNLDRLARRHRLSTRQVRRILRKGAGQGVGR